MNRAERGLEKRFFVVCTERKQKPRVAVDVCRECKKATKCLSYKEYLKMEEKRDRQRAAKEKKFLTDIDDILLEISRKNRTVKKELEKTLAEKEEGAQEQVRSAATPSADDPSPPGEAGPAETVDREESG